MLVTVVMITLLLSSATQLVSFAGHGNAKNTHVTKWILNVMYSRWKYEMQVMSESFNTIKGTKWSFVMGKVKVLYQTALEMN